MNKLTPDYLRERFQHRVAEFSTAIRKISAKRRFDNQKDCIFLISCVYLRSIQYPNFLHLNDLKSHLLQNSDFFVWCYNGNTRLNYLNPRLTWFTKSQAISCQLDFNSLHPHAYIICCTNDASHNVTGCSNPNVHAQFPWAIPYLIVSDYYWFSISGTFLLQVCHYCATFNYTPKSWVTQLSSNP